MTNYGTITYNPYGSLSKSHQPMQFLYRIQDTRFYFRNIYCFYRVDSLQKSRKCWINISKRRQNNIMQQDKHQLTINEIRLLSPFIGNWYFILINEVERQIILKHQTLYCRVGWGSKIHQLHFCREMRLSNDCPVYDNKQSDGEATVMPELWSMRSSPLLPSHPGPH